MARREDGREDREHRRRKQADALAVKPPAEDVERRRHGNGIGNGKQADGQNVRAEQFEKRRIQQRDYRRLVEVDVAVEHFAAQQFFAGSEPQPVILIEMAGVEDAQQESDGDDGGEYFEDRAAAKVALGAGLVAGRRG